MSKIDTPKQTTITRYLKAAIKGGIKRPLLTANVDGSFTITEADEDTPKNPASNPWDEVYE